MADTAQEKTEEPTPKRLREAREKGQVPRSKELGTLAGVAMGILVVGIMAGQLGSVAQDYLQQNLSLTRDQLLQPMAIPEHVAGLMVQGMLFTAPLLVAGFLAAFVGPVLFGGWNFSTKALAPDPNKLNPLTGLKRIFSLNALMELFKALAKFLLLGGLSVMVLWGWHDTVLGLGEMDLRAGVATGLKMCLWTLAALCIGLAIIAGIDVPFQHFNHRKQLRMSLQEVKDEMKETEGRPEVKQHIRETQQQMARKRMSTQIPEASVVINNPEHFSVALRYDSETGDAPVVVAKGSDHLAEVIRELAREHKVPQLRVPPLARALYRHVDVDQPIPAGLFLAVAQILSYIYALDSNPQAASEQPDPEIPPEYQWSPGGKSADSRLIR